MERERFALTQVRRRLRRMAEVTKRFAAGLYDQRFEVIIADEVGQIQANLNQVAEQFVEILAREKILVEQNARLEERARLSQDLQAKGLTTALRDYVTTWSRQCRIAADLSLPETCLLPLAVEEALWRVTQEALSNVARHSGASLVQLHLEWTEQHVSLYVSDHGQGFEVTT